MSQEFCENADGDKFWFKDGKFHREDGPAREYADGSKEWYLNGQNHRVDGPAVEFFNGKKKWWINGMRYSETKHSHEAKIWCKNNLINFA